MGGEEAYIFYVIILAIVGIATLVRKAIEKASSGEKGKRINLAEAVQRQLRKYMGTPEAPTGGSPGPPEYEEELPERMSSRAPPALVLRPAEARPQRGEDQPVATLVTKRAFALTDAAQSATQRARDTVIVPGLDRKSLKRAIVMAEILGPAICLREDYRLF